jgi:hypothetical protein
VTRCSLYLFNLLLFCQKSSLGFIWFKLKCMHGATSIIQGCLLLSLESQSFVFLHWMPFCFRALVLWFYMLHVVSDHNATDPVTQKSCNLLMQIYLWTLKGKATQKRKNLHINQLNNVMKFWQSILVIYPLDKLQY